jgi:hypothetical protein
VNLDKNQKQQRTALLAVMEQIDGYARLLQSRVHTLLALGEQEGKRSELRFDSLAQTIVLDLFGRGLRMTEVLHILVSAIRSISLTSVITTEIDYYITGRKEEAKDGSNSRSGRHQSTRRRNQLGDPETASAPKK